MQDAPRRAETRPGAKAKAKLAPPLPRGAGDRDIRGRRLSDSASEARLDPVGEGRRSGG